MLINRFRGYDVVELKTQVFQEAPPALGPDVNGRLWLTCTTPDGVARPMLVRLEFQRCQECRALVLEQDVNAHTDWHGRIMGRLERLEERASSHADWHGEQRA